MDGEGCCRQSVDVCECEEREDWEGGRWVEGAGGAIGQKKEGDERKVEEREVTGEEGSGGREESEGGCALSWCMSDQASCSG